MAKKAAAKKTPAKQPAGVAAGKSSTAKAKVAKAGKTSSESNGTPAVAGTAWSGAEVGHTAGRVWQQLAEQGPQTIAALKKGVGGSPDMVMSAVGWLAREGKLAFRTSGRTMQVGLVEEPPA